MEKLQQQADNLQRNRNAEQPPKLESIWQFQKIQAAQGENLSEYELNCSVNSATLKSYPVS